MTDPLDATAPEAHATVMAAAGTGKTWLLVTRVVRLLLAGARPEGILAVTFTRKAAAEMLERLHERLLAYAGADDDELNEALGLIGLEPDEGLRARARRMYEELLASPRPPRMTTFHSFCQEILQRFPLEADVPPGFELVDTAGPLEQQALDALYQEATTGPDGALGRALEELFDGCAGLDNTQKALTDFLHHRSDWWAFTDGANDPVARGVRSLLTALQVDPERDYAAELFDERTRAGLNAFGALLARHGTKTNRGHAERLGEALGEARDELPARERLKQIQTVFFTAKGERRRRGPGKTQQRSLGADGEARLLALHESLCERLEAVRDQIARTDTFALTRAWYRAGQRLIEHFQRIKRERRWLDFIDLEWTTCCLVSDAESAHWIQYKLDRRIDHILVDEFQDTNPTQWRLLLPLLEELAAGAGERARSVFLVGDDKQSIYGFRRADPRLLHSAGGWLRRRLGALTCPLDHSRRSSPAIIECVNAVFARAPLAERIGAFQAHDTHRGELWGRVELLPLVRAAPQEEREASGDGGLRDPLLSPRVAVEDRRHYEEGRAIAERIGRLVAERTPVVDDRIVRPLRYGDVLILLRKRAPATALEQALRDAGIPYLGTGRGTLLESLEVSDMEALLSTLINPYDNLALAQVLRSPVFAADDADLVRLACAGDGTWRERLAEMAPGLPDDHPLHRAHRLLGSWETLAGRVPVHDLLDRIYSEADLPSCYEAAFPRPLRPRVHANLARFIELALEVDSGRYPTLPGFLERLRQLKRHPLEAPDEPPSLGGEDRVRIMTVHGAKGLEAPVVWLAD
ncbi:MAG: UvrD-helicase domain-containing protein, partial [Gammaproteobacteria bacterium]|nr:UvrD-helicase domain-containing protein [Gammaproteobacteria bacterium]NIR98921.1 UvrD-helicase domain-containing protein [Gammaproteobacteria bacterium]NIT64569.1 UvrD-helicase domain-containing protein [Gammaproteobacteria bacterium]NIV21499.1 UvrD-helicase domain-containing protein [Gammaproteobacteria bacterium]NIY33149.1 UvrD-helicase domain-containing protein [Gammaproteobacteria bacterium]